MNTFLLLDNAMLAAGDHDVIPAADRPDWLTCLYDEHAAAASPHLIDLHGADEAGQMDQVMSYFNATPEKLHASFIDSTLTHVDLAQHLRHFIMIRQEGGNNLTLRFADCTVLPHLANVFAPEQWAALVWPMARWRVHGYDGKLITLPCADASAPRSTTPLLLAQSQLTLLREAMLPNNVLASLRAMRHGARLPGSTADQLAWGSDALQRWHNAGNAHDIVLRWLTAAAIDTHGALLQQKSVDVLLALPDLEAIRTALQTEVADHNARANCKGTFQ